jgi:hypothetical protein
MTATKLMSQQVQFCGQHKQYKNKYPVIHPPIALYIFLVTIDYLSEWVKPINNEQQTSQSSSAGFRVTFSEALLELTSIDPSD